MLIESDTVFSISVIETDMFPLLSLSDMKKASSAGKNYRTAQGRIPPFRVILLKSKFDLGSLI